MARVFDRQHPVGITIPGGDPSTPRALPIKAQLQYYASQFRNGGTQWSVLPNAHAGRRKELEGAEPVGTSSIRGRRPNSSPIGSGSRPNSVNSLELLESRLSLLGDKAGPVPFSIAAQF